METTMKKWGEMSDEEREDFLNGLDQSDKQNTRRYRRKIKSVGGLCELSEAELGDFPIIHSSDTLLSRFYCGKIPCEK